MDKTIVWPVLFAFAISAILGPVLIPFLKKLKVGQTERDDGPQSHLKKTGTPTMGGVLILLAVLIPSLFYVRDYPGIVPVLLGTLGFGLIGFVDDFIKVVLKRSMGLRAWQKMLGQILVSGGVIYYFVHCTDYSLAMKVPFWSGHVLDFGIWNIPIMFFILIATANGTNFTDGLDGLAGSVTLAVAVFLAAVSVGTESGIHPVACAMIGALLGFLLFNSYPAKVFMGDTGSLALGGFVAVAAYTMQLQLFIPIIGFIYLIEVVSVILQVVYFKITKGKRIFKMAPIHHHFELCGWAESKVVAVFSIVTAVLCCIAWLGL